MRQILNNAPEITVVFWVIKILCTTVGETFADLLNEKLGLGFTLTTYVMGTLSIHSITSIRREVFHWLTILFTFALGTAAGDLVGEKFGPGYLWSVVLWGSLITVITVAHSRFGLNAVLAF